MKKLIQYAKIALLTIILAEEVRKAMKSENEITVDASKIRNYLMNRNQIKFQSFSPSRGY